MSYSDKAKNTAYEKERRAKNPASVVKKNAATAAWYQRNKKYADHKANEWRRRERLRLLNMLGGSCLHCGYDNPVALDFDHINNDGYLDKKTRSRSYVIYAVKRDPSRFQVLCKNCNWIKEAKRREDAYRKR